MKLQNLHPRTPSSLSFSIRRSLFKSDLELLKLREGLRLHWYLDTLGKKTGGYGHLWRRGDPVVFEQKDAERWLEIDSGAARKSALKLFNQLPFQTQSLLDVLVSCQYQFGNDFDKDFPKTWRLMLEGDYMAASKEAEKSLWFKQTPVRVRDLQQALSEAYLLARQYADLGL